MHYLSPCRPSCASSCVTKAVYIYDSHPWSTLCYCASAALGHRHVPLCMSVARVVMEMISMGVGVGVGWGVVGRLRYLSVL